MKETTDIRWLAEAARHGDAQACKVIVEQCGRQMFSVVRRMVVNVMDAEEVTQDALMRGLQQMEQYDPNRASLATWFYRIAYRMALNHLRKSEMGTLSFDDEDSHVEQATNEPQLPDDFAQKLQERIRTEREKQQTNIRPRRWWNVAAILVGVLLMSGVVFAVVQWAVPVAPQAGDMVGNDSVVVKETKYSRRGYKDASMNDTEWCWNARLSRPFAKGKFLLMLDGFDLLNQLSNITQTINAQGRTETWTNTLHRYVLLHAVWRMNHQPKKRN